MLFDTHAHLLDEKFDDDRQQIIDSFPDMGISLMLEACTDENTSLRGVDLAEKNERIYCAVGVHPHEAKDVSENYLDVIEKLAAHEKCVAIGEIGLDHHYDFSPRENQAKVFLQQIQLAKRLELPIIVHDREAHADVMALIKSEPGVRGVMHCYSGSLEFAKQYLDLGFYISFAGPVTFHNAHKAKEVATYVPLDRLLCETDSPYLAPVPKRGKRNDPTNVRFVVMQLAVLQGYDFEKVAEATLQNGKRLFGIE